MTTTKETLSGDFATHRLECGGKRDTALDVRITLDNQKDPKRRRRCALPAHSTWVHAVLATGLQS